MNRISKNIAITLSSQILNFAFGFIASIILARVLGPNNRGIFALIILVPSMMLKFGSLGIETANVYYTGNKKYPIEDVVSNSLIFAPLLGVVLILIFWAASKFDFFQNFLNANRIDPMYLWIVVYTVPLSLVLSFLNYIILGKEEVGKYNFINICQSFIRFICIFVFLAVFNTGVLGAVISHCIAIAAGTLLVILFIWKITRLHFRCNRELFKRLATYGLKSYLGNIIQFFNYRLDMFLVAFFLSPTAVGLYSIAVGIAEMFWMLPGAIATVLFPRISSINSTHANGLTPGIARHTFFIIFVAALICAALAEPMIEIFFGASFLPSVRPLLVLLPGIVALGGTKTLTADLAGRGQPQYGTYAAIVSLAVNVPLNIVLIPRWGISGAAFASSVAYILSSLMVLTAFVKISKTSWVDILLVKKQDFNDYRAILRI